MTTIMRRRMKIPEKKIIYLLFNYSYFNVHLHASIIKENKFILFKKTFVGNFKIRTILTVELGENYYDNFVSFRVMQRSISQVYRLLHFRLRHAFLLKPFPLFQINYVFFR